jgi:hypothetical protein
MTKLLPFYTAVIVFALMPFIWFAALPSWIASLALAALLACLALEVWKAARR